ncbi:MAG TPA: hypothetical protein VFE58_04895, partial [Tepidisphaeraceae bacterium]|nr:hypothetical protein [Tepidisphaeraceae bacterium]
MQRFCIGLLALAAMGVSAQGAVLMATGFNDQLYVVNQATGAATGAVTVTGGLSIAGMAQGTDGTIYLDSDAGGSNAALYTLNAGTHVSTLVGGFGQTFMYEGDLAISPVTGNMVAAYAYVPGVGISLMNVNKGTGAG